MLVDENLRGKPLFDALTEAFELVRTENEAERDQVSESDWKIWEHARDQIAGVLDDNRDTPDDDELLGIAMLLNSATRLDPAERQRQWEQAELEAAETKPMSMIERIKAAIRVLRDGR